MATGMVCLCVLGSAYPTASAPFQQDGKVVDQLIIDSVAQISGSTGGVSVVQISPQAFAFSFNFGEVSPINTNPVVRVAATLTATTSGIREIRMSVPSRTFADPEMLQYSDIGTGVQNIFRIGGGGCAASAFPPFNNDPATSMTISPATGRATYPATLANLVNPAGVPVLKLIAAPQGIRFDLVFACAPSYYTPGSSTFVVTVTLNVSSGNPCA